MSIRRVGDSYQVYGYNASTKRNAYVGTFEDEAEAQFAELEYKTGRRGRQTEEAPQIGLQALSDSFTASLTLRATTISDYKKCVKRIVAILGDLPVSKIDRTRVDDLIVTLTASYAPRTVRKTVLVFRMILDRGIDLGYLETLPFGRSRVRLPKIQKKMFRPLTDDEVRRLLAAAPDRWRLFYLTALYTGCRRGELGALDWKRSVDLDRKEILVREQLQDGKIVPLKTSASYRIIPIPDLLVDELKKFAKPSGLLFTDSKGGLINQSSWNANIWIPTRERAALPELTLHQLRHQYASQLLRNHASITFVSKALGHESPAVTLSVYSHLIEDETSEAMAALDSVARRIVRNTQEVPSS
jgi:integrase